MKISFRLVLSVVLLAALVVLGTMYLVKTQPNSPNNNGNNTTSIISDDLEYDNALEGQKLLGNNPKLGDGYVSVIIGYKGNGSIRLSLDTFAIYQGFFGAWSVLNQLTKTVEVDANHSKLFFTYPTDAADYNNIYLYIRSAQILDNGTWKDMKLINPRLWIAGDYVLVNNNQTAIALVFDGNRSIFKDGNGDYIFAPNFRLDTYLNVSLVDKAGNLIIESGEKWTSVPLGMNINGTVSSGFGIPYSATIMEDKGKFWYTLE